MSMHADDFDRKIKLADLYIKIVTSVVAIGSLWFAVFQYIDQRERELKAKQVEIMQAIMPGLLSESKTKQQAALFLLEHLGNDELANKVLDITRNNQKEEVILRKAK